MDTSRLFVERLRRLKPHPAAFNPWRETDSANDCRPDASLIRRNQLRVFLDARLACARYCLIGEASGYQGAHFTGIPMTSERILLGNLRDLGILPGHILPGIVPRRTSKPGIKPAGFSEPTATIVWKAIGASGRDPREFVIWNTVCLHTFDPKKGMLSNRCPATREIETFLPVLKDFLGMFPSAQVIAVGNSAAKGLGMLGVNFLKFRHPAQGGSTLFRRQMKELL